MYKFGEESRRNMKGVDSRLIDVLNEAIKLMDISVLEGLRSKERQLILYKAGDTKVKHSKHMDGMAVDVAPYPIDWEDRERFHYMGGMMRGIAQQKGHTVRWGGDWDKDGEVDDNDWDDLPHIELKDA